MAEQFIEINTDQIQRPNQVENDLFTNRQAIARMYGQSAPAEVSIIVVGFNRLEKTQRCVESILRYTQGIDYELILVDSGSSDGTLEFFQSVACGKKRVIHITQNLGAAYAYTTISLRDLGDFVCIAPNDLIVTKDWLKNLLACMKSDPKIGMVTPMTSNSSNLQSLDFPYQSYGEMQKIAAQFNRSDPKKWEDRLRLITLGTVFRREVFLASGWPLNDVGYFHDFLDDDMAFAVRALGYRTVLAGDTWICHDHNVRGGEGKNLEEFQRSLQIGRENFKSKHFGVDAWDDVNNFYSPYFDGLKPPSILGEARILGVDVRCGTPILDAKNWLRKNGLFSVQLSAFTQDPKYWKDLKSICEGGVFCDREEFLADAFPQEYFDIVIADRSVNQYHEPQKLINDLFGLCKKGGLVICKLRNTFTFQEYLYLLGQRKTYDLEYSYHIPAEAVQDALEKLGALQKRVALPFMMDLESQETLRSILPEGFSAEQKNDLLSQMLSREYLLFVQK